MSDYKLSHNMRAKNQQLRNEKLYKDVFLFFVFFKFKYTLLCTSNRTDERGLNVNAEIIFYFISNGVVYI